MKKKEKKLVQTPSPESSRISARWSQNDEKRSETKNCLFPSTSKASNGRTAMSASRDAAAAAAAASSFSGEEGRETELVVLDTAGITAEAGNSESTLSPQNPSVEIVALCFERFVEISPTYLLESQARAAAAPPAEAASVAATTASSGGTEPPPAIVAAGPAAEAAAKRWKTLTRTARRSGTIPWARYMTFFGVVAAAAAAAAGVDDDAVVDDEDDDEEVDGEASFSCRDASSVLNLLVNVSPLRSP